MSRKTDAFDGSGSHLPTSQHQKPVSIPTCCREPNRVDQVWAADITYIPMAQGFLYLVAIMDWHSRQVLAWKLSNTMDTGFCVAALEEALNRGRPEIFNSDQGAQFSQRGLYPDVAGARVSVGRMKGTWTLHLRGAAVAEHQVSRR